MEGRRTPGDYRSKVTPAAVLGSLAAWEIRYSVPVVWAGTPEAGAAQVEVWGWYFAREHVERVNQLFRKAAMLGLATS